jgi:hypothetical protein
LTHGENAPVDAKEKVQTWKSGAKVIDRPHSARVEDSPSPGVAHQTIRVSDFPLHLKKNPTPKNPNVPPPSCHSRKFHFCTKLFIYIILAIVSLPINHLIIH